MSEQEQSMPLVKEDVKQKPEVRPRSSTQNHSSPPANEGNGIRVSDGKVKEIVKILSKQESKEQEEHTTNNYTELPSSNKKPPLKAKPNRTASQLQSKAAQLPPLPKKRSHFLKKARSREEGVSVKGGRSAPDGKEVEAQMTGGDEAEVEHNLELPLSFCSDHSCSCVCHLPRPGMMLIWVPVDAEAGEQYRNVKEQTPKKGKDCKKKKEEEEGEEEEDVAQEVKEDSKVTEEVDSAPVEDRHVSKQEKSIFLQRLNDVFADPKRISGQGLTAGKNPPQPSPAPPKPAPSLPVHETPSQEEEEENIYELHLPEAAHIPKKTLAVKDLLDFSRTRVQIPTTHPNYYSSTLGCAPTAVEPNPASDDGCGKALVPPVVPLKTSMSSDTPPPSRLPPRPPKKDPRRPSNVMDSLITGEIVKGEGSKDTRRSSNVSVDSLLTVENGSGDGGKDSREPSPIRRRSSFKWDPHLKNEPLYQVYRKTVIKDEISRQTICRNISKTSDEFPPEWAARRKGSDVSTLEGEGRSSTLWQDVPEVRDSGVLKQLTTKQLKYQESMFEVLTSEASYLRSLCILTEHFLDNRELKETMIIRDRKTLFSNIVKIREVSERFLKDLNERIFKDIIFLDICDIIHYHAQHNFPAYIDYVRNQIYQEKTFTTLKKNNANFASVINHLQESPQCQRLPFVSFLLLPFQRITRIKMLLENILKRTVEGTKEEQTAIKALDSVTKIIDKCNTEVGKMRQMEELIQLSGTLEFDSKLKAIPIISETRYLEKKGELHEMSRGKTLVNMRAKFNPVHLFLFNDLLIIAVKKGAERFVVTDHSHRSLVQVQPYDEGNYENCFNLIILENHQGRMVERLLKAPSQSDLHRWLAAFPDSFNKDEEETIYEDFDCPQVQCVEQYIAKQADELSLEPAEIINIIRKTNEGWYEGIRLTDGQKGWFPVENIIEITNDHVRRKNLLERYRVTQAASMMKDNKTR